MGLLGPRVCPGRFGNMTHFAVLALLLASSHGTRPIGSRPFTYDATQLQAWYRANHVNTLEPIPTGKANSLLGPTHVSVSGNFGGVFNVSGIGTASSQMETNTVAVNTNRSLTFTANSFKPLMVGNTSETVMGSITYSMALYQGTPSHIGSLVSGPVSGVDSGFSGQTLTLGNAQISSDGNYVLVLTRTLNLTEKAMGAYRLVGTGNIGVTIN